MTMRKLLFLVYDPGGYDAVYPLVQKARQLAIPYLFYACGPSSSHGENQPGNDEILEQIRLGLDNNEFAGLITGTSWGSQLELIAIRMFREKELLTISLLDYWSNYRTRFELSHGDIVFPDYLIVMDEIAYSEAVADGVPESIMRVLGHPGLDHFIDMSLNKPNRTSGKRQIKVLFLSQPLSELYGTSLGYTEYDVIQNCIETFEKASNVTFHLKFHPKDGESLRNKYHMWSINGDLLDLFPDYDLIVGMSTMGLLHAALLGIPIVSYQPNLYAADEAITNKLGLSHAIYSSQEWERFVNSGMYGYMEACHDRNPQHLLWMDGHSTKRVMNFVREVLKV
jgi:hypothetical protein